MVVEGINTFREPWKLNTSISDTFHYVSCGASILRKRIVISNRNRTKPTALSRNIIMRSYPAKKRYAILGGSWQLPYGRWQHNGTMILLSSHRHKQWGQLCENHTGVSTHDITPVMVWYIPCCCGCRGQIQQKDLQAIKRIYSANNKYSRLFMPAVFTYRRKLWTMKWNAAISIMPI